MTKNMLIDGPTETDRDTSQADPAGRGIALCLGMLADEAAEQGFAESSLAIRRAIAVLLVEAAGVGLRTSGRMN